MERLGYFPPLFCVLSYREEIQGSPNRTRVSSLNEAIQESVTSYNSELLVTWLEKLGLEHWPDSHTWQLARWEWGWRKEGEETGRVGKKDSPCGGEALPMLRREAEKKNAFLPKSPDVEGARDHIEGLNEWQLTPWPWDTLFCLGKRVRQ